MDSVGRTPPVTTSGPAPDKGRPVPAHASGGGFSMSRTKAFADARISSNRCRRAPNDQPLSSRREAHRAKMRQKRLTRSMRTVDFTPVVNRRVNEACQAVFAVIKLSNPSISTADAQEQAVHRVARNLPAAPKVFDWRQGAVSKNNDPAYRKPFVRDTLTLARRWHLPVGAA